MRTNSSFVHSVTYKSNEIKLRKTSASFLKSSRATRWGKPIYSSASFIYFLLRSHAAALTLSQFSVPRLAGFLQNEYALQVREGRGRERGGRREKRRAKRFRQKEKRGSERNEKAGAAWPSCKHCSPSPQLKLTR